MKPLSAPPDGEVSDVQPVSVIYHPENAVFVVPSDVNELIFRDSGKLWMAAMVDHEDPATWHFSEAERVVQYDGPQGAVTGIESHSAKYEVAVTFDIDNNVFRVPLWIVEFTFLVDDEPWTAKYNGQTWEMMIIEAINNPPTD
ncbi:hypothetical protein [Anoxynatronum buryatiense]|nr:hypothetical protein [Anoxynatronum buryatiense]